jgi:sugar lactone lactonase YvrE/predicted glycoside hydrolase/deacetylase ChbG (UPF0249 family)
MLKPQFVATAFSAALCIQMMMIAKSFAQDQATEKSNSFSLKLQWQDKASENSPLFSIRERDEKWPAAQTAVIVCDVWDYHHSINAVRRLEEFAPRLNEVLNKSRELGATIIHAPSDCMDFYRDHPARLRAQSLKPAIYRPKTINDWCSALPIEEATVYPIDQSDGGSDDLPEEGAEWAAKLKGMGRNAGLPWQSQSPMITIDRDRDYISDRGDEIWNILDKKGIQNVILTGVHVNMCVLGRPFGLRQMAQNGKRVALMRDMTDAMYNPASWPYVSHFTGNDLVISHIERYVCPTVTSDQVLGGKPFRFSKDLRPRLAVIVSESLLREIPWLPSYSISSLGKLYAVDLISAQDFVTKRRNYEQVSSTNDLFVLGLKESDIDPATKEWIRHVATSAKPVLTLTTPLHSAVSRIAFAAGSSLVPIDVAHPDSLETDEIAQYQATLFEALRTTAKPVFDAVPTNRRAIERFISHWDRVNVPSTWSEALGKEWGESDSVGWYRSVLKSPLSWTQTDDLTIQLGTSHTSENTAVFLNGTQLSYKSEGAFSVDGKLLQADDHNLIVIRVANSKSALLEAPEVTSPKLALTLSLRGTWQFRLGDDPAFSTIPLPAKFGGGSDIVYGPKDDLWSPRILTKPGEFTAGIEGPACDRAGNIYAVNYAEEGTIGRVTPEGQANVYVRLPEGSVGNGIRFDSLGNFFVADYTKHNILRVDAVTKKITVLAHNDAMSQPNDIAIAEDGTLYASDPNWANSTGQLWRIDPDGKTTLLAKDMGTTNGIDISPDGKTLYVNESAQRNIWAFTITADKQLADKRLFKKFDDHGFDGMRTDVDGNLYVTRYGKGTVVKLSPDAEVLQEIPVLGSRPSNICFGGPDGCTAYVTEVEFTRLVAFRVDRPGREWRAPRKLVIHADDAGMSHSVNEGTIEALEKGIVTSASIIVPAPWFKEFAVYAKNHPQYDYGIHLALNSEWEVYRWGSVAPADKVSSLLDEEGYLWDNVAQVAEHAKLEEVEIELRAQIDKALQFGVPISHLDTHMGALMSRPDLIDLYVRIGLEYKLPVLFLSDRDGSLRKAYPALIDRLEKNINRLRETQLPVLDHLIQIYGGEDLEQRKLEYFEAISRSPLGVSELIIHCGIDNPELRAITSSSRRRNQDRELFSHPDTANFLRQQGIELTSWKQLHQEQKSIR